MKLINKIATAFTCLALLASCSDIEDALPQGGTMLSSQLKETTAAIVSRTDASFIGMYNRTGIPASVYGLHGDDTRPDDFGFPMVAFSSDLEAADVIVADSGFNWFSTCGELSSRSADYANPYIRYKAPYNTIADCNDVIKAFDPDTEDEEILYKIAQAKAMRAFAYLNLAPYFQFKYVGNEDKPCVPLVDENTSDYANNPRATNKAIYELILGDLDYAIEHLAGFKRTDKSKIDQKVAYGLRARAYLNMERWVEAAEDAAMAAEGFTPASISDVSKPFLMSLNEPNWIWGFDYTTEMINQTFGYATPSAWIRSFSGDGYSAACQCYAMINKILYDKIPATDVRKGWWLDENLESPLVAGAVWTNGQPFVTAEVEDLKMECLPYTNVKFGMSSIGSTLNDEDWCYMRVEEMILIQVEGLYRSGKQGEAKSMLEDFVKTYRDPSYSVDSPTITTSFENEIWFQRRVELWGEGFSNNDTRRLGKPLVRFHSGQDTNVPDNFKFNMTADDPWWLMRFPQDETNTNLAVVDNEGGNQPEPDQHAELTDGVTD